jgi:hypothetical protein
MLGRVGDEVVRRYRPQRREPAPHGVRPSVAQAEPVELTLQRLVGNRTVTHLLRTDPGSIQRGRLGIGNTKTAATATLQDKGFDYATGHSGSGQWTDEVGMQGAGSFSGERVRQLLRHLSTVVFAYVKQHVEEEQEVQAMYVNGRILLSSNDPASMRALRSVPKERIRSVLIGDESPQGADRSAMSAEKLSGVLEGSRMETLTFDQESERPSMQAISNMVDDPQKYLPLGSIDQAAAWVDDDDHRGNVILVESMADAHAEQNLILTYVKSRSMAQAHVYGKKRPCTGCYLTFRFAREQLGRVGLTHSDRPGGFWGPATRGLYFVAKEKSGLDLEAFGKFVEANAPARTYRTKTGRRRGNERKARTDTKQEETGYDTGSDSEVEEPQRRSERKKRKRDPGPDEPITPHAVVSAEAEELEEDLPAKRRAFRTDPDVEIIEIEDDETP